MNVRKELEKIIYNWVAENFGKSEAEDPSWSIRELAKEINRHMYEIYHGIEMNNIKEDVKYVAGDRHVRLSDEQISQVAEMYYNSDTYGELDTWLIEHLIERVKE